jgi:acyl-CoA reductase-like NAD-dependent aldehyde dehydrogenase/nicotinamidase-related amidase
VKPTLLLVDLQRDFLVRPGLEPAAEVLVAEARVLLEACRARGIGVAHVHTRVLPDGSNRMPHWKENGIWSCVDKSAGAEPPRELRPEPGEAVFEKQFFSAFQAPGLAAHLAAQGTDTLIVAGAYLHACVRASVLEAYERGYEVWVAEDAVGSTEPVHAELSRDYLEQRAARFLSIRAILAALDPRSVPPPIAGSTVAAACIAGRFESGGARTELVHFNPSHSDELLTRVAVGTAETVQRAARAARAAQSGASHAPGELRRAWLEAWAAGLERRSGALVDTLCREIGKPRLDAQEELKRALAHVRVAAQLADGERPVRAADRRFRGVPGRVRRRPIGVVGIVTPWNNPVAIPAGKLAPALALGNAVVWKPAPQTALCSMLVLEALLESGLDPGLVNLVFGDASTTRSLASTGEVDALSFTGSTRAGRGVAALCTAYSKPLQAELGGNNAHVVLADCYLEAEVRGLALAAFRCAGQRCTATRRFVVQRSIAEEFRERFEAAVRSLHIGDPSDASTEVGPMISTAHRERTLLAIEAALERGAKKLCGGGVLPGREHGSWLEPTVLDAVDGAAPIARQETFGPLALVIEAEGLEQAIDIVNDVPHGLVAGLSSSDEEAQAVFLERVQAGVLKLGAGPLELDPEAPFGGWKASGIGPPEHGLWDEEFYSRPQTVYGRPGA